MIDYAIGDGAAETIQAGSHRSPASAMRCEPSRGARPAAWMGRHRTMLENALS
jgi:hypothetical protein